MKTMIKNRHIVFSLFLSFLILTAVPLAGVRAEDSGDQAAPAAADTLPANDDSAPDAAKIDTAIKNCAETEDRFFRLMCYDKISQDLGYMDSDKVAREGQVIKKIGFWEISKKTTGTGDNVIYLRLKSSLPAISPTGGRRYPRIILECSHARTQVYLDWDRKLITGSYGTGGVITLGFKYQFDDDPSEEAKWEISTDKKALFATDPVDFVKRMRQHEKMIMQIASAGDPVASLIFDMRGINEALGILVKECYN